jgi:ubiquinone/menaquinone biosynthesis C-methylase UbiE
MPTEAQKIQEEYYKKTAENYDEMHLKEGEDAEHQFALSFLSAMIELYSIKSVLDVGAGTGRTITYLKEKFPNIHIVGIEPVDELRAIGYEKGIPKDILMDGSGTAMTFKDGEFDLVCEFAVLHHVGRPQDMVGEMLRVAKKAIFISDSNNFGQGGATSRIFKQAINSLGLWKAYNFAKTKGKGYQITEGDGLAYSYSVFNNYNQIKKACKTIHTINTKGESIDHYSSAEHVALFAVK